MGQKTNLKNVQKLIKFCLHGLKVCTPIYTIHVQAITKSIPYVPQTSASARKSHTVKSAKDCGISEL